MTQLTIIIILTFGIGVLTSNCQNKLSYDFMLSSNYCYRDLKINNNNITELFESIIKSRNELEQSKISYKVGLGANYHIKMSYFSIGLFFSNKGYQATPDLSNAVFPDPIHPLYGPIYSQNTTPNNAIKKFTFKYNYIYLDIPLSYSYIFFERKLKLFLSLGLQGNILISANSETIIYYSDGSKIKKYTNDKTEYEKLNFSIEGGLGIEFPITNKLNIIIEPYYERNISTTIQAPIKQYLYSIGLYAKLRYK